jgi:hypothetical protein
MARAPGQPLVERPPGPARPRPLQVCLLLLRVRAGHLLRTHRNKNRARKRRRYRREPRCPRRCRGRATPRRRRDRAEPRRGRFTPLQLPTPPPTQPPPLLFSGPSSLRIFSGPCARWKGREWAGSLSHLAQLNRHL